MKLLNVYHFCLALFSVAGSLVNAQCNEETCTAKCYPDIWDRDLCQFYSELSSWRSTAEECGLSIPPLPMRDRTLSAEDQWMEARNYWNMILNLWKNETAISGIHGTGSPNDVVDQSQSSWVQLMSTWEHEYAQWSDYVRGQSGPLPESNVTTVILNHLESDQRPDSIRSNSRNWATLIDEWRYGHLLYNETYSGTCRRR